MPGYRESIVFRIDCEPVCLIWSGHGPLPLPADAVIPSPETALGAGELVSVPDIEQLMNGTTQRAEIVLSGVSEETTRLAVEDAPTVAGARVDLGVASFDADWQLISVEWTGTFEARSLSVGRPQAQGGQIVRSITLTIAAGDTTRSRAPMAFFTDSDQRRRSGDDAIFSHVAMINSGTSRRFGPSD